MATLADITPEFKAKLPPAVQAAIDVFSPDEQRQVTLIYSFETGKFEGVGMIDSDLKFWKPGNPEKYNALQVIEAQVRHELIERGELL